MEAPGIVEKMDRESEKQPIPKAEVLSWVQRLELMFNELRGVIPDPITE